MISFLDLHAGYRELKEEIDSTIQRVLNSGAYVLGPEVESFEEEWSLYCGSRFAVTVANGLDALILSMKALDIGPGDEVIVPSNTYIATWLAVAAVGAKPIPVDPLLDTHNIGIEQIQNRVTSKTKAIIPVHLYGQPVDLDPILRFARERDLFVIEDAAQAHGAMYKKQRIGKHSDIVCWSFYPGKNLGAFGDGGAITTSKPEIATRIRLLRNYGSDKKYIHTEKGVNSRLDPLQAAILRIKLKYLDEWNLRRKSIASLYSSSFKNIAGFVPNVPDWADPVWHLYVVRHARRDELKAHLEKAGIQTLIHYPTPPHLQMAFQDRAIKRGQLPICEILSNQILSLPIGPHLSASDAQKVVEAVLCFVL